MSVQNGERLATKQDLADMYQGILPYLGGIVTSKAGFTPIGTIISVMGTTAPVNYLACDGTVYNIADYTELANYFNEQFGSKNFFGGDGTTTFAVPDLRGEFLRGTGTNSHVNQGNGASVGVHQDATLHRMHFYDGSNLCLAGGQSTNVDTEQTGKSRGYTGQNGTDASGKFYTSRPTNTSVLYCIATKNFYIDPTLDYSTDEKIVGTWIDGSPVWQRVYTGITVNVAVNDWSIGIIDANMKPSTHFIVKMDVLSSPNNFTTDEGINMTYWGATNDHAMIHKECNESRGLHVQIHSAYSGTQSLVAVVQYVKKST